MKMFFRILLGAVVATKTVKLIRKEIDLYKLKACGIKLGIPYIPGENLEEYRNRLLNERNKN
jgi:hypothetical protein